MIRLLWALMLCLPSLAVDAMTRAGVAIGPPQISIIDLAPHDGVAAGFVAGGPSVEAFRQLLAPAPVESFAEGQARIVRNEPGAIAGESSGSDSTFLIVGDRYAPSFTFTATPHSRVTVSTDYRLQTALSGERFDADEPPRALSSVELKLVAIGNLSFIDRLGDFDYDVLAVETTADSLASPLDRAFDGDLERRGTLSVSFDNLSGGDAVFAFRGEMVAFGVSATCRRPTSKAGLGWLLIGLTGFGAQARRRRVG